MRDDCYRIAQCQLSILQGFVARYSSKLRLDDLDWQLTEMAGQWSCAHSIEWIQCCLVSATCKTSTSEGRAGRRGSVRSISLVELSSYLVRAAGRQLVEEREESEPWKHETAKHPAQRRTSKTAGSSRRCITRMSLFCLCDTRTVGTVDVVLCVILRRNPHRTLALHIMILQASKRQ